MTTLFAGFGLSLSLIVAIGAQNAFVLRQGLLRQHVLPLVMFCACSDALLINVGVAGFGNLAEALPWFEPVMRYGGAAFLIVYGARSAQSAWRGGAALEQGEGQGMSLRATLLTCMLFTWANPHVYLDTVVLLGSIAAQYEDRTLFAIGASAASFVFFFSLGYGARLLGPLFARPRAWQVLDAGIALLMWFIAYTLLTGG
ncbi:LysE/ArgO family amino acid transporter [Phaeobacter sp. CNT1-3]|nr:LysE/ArgO family amino acid transporter [Phaeobacter sp. CNT1-3]